MSDGDWDLYAVVRSCTTAAAVVNNNQMEEDVERNQPISDCSSYQNSNVAYSYPDQNNNVNHGLEEIYEPFSMANTDFETEEIIHQPQLQEAQSNNYSLAITSPQSSPIRSRRRKNQHLKMVYQMTQEELSGDTWAWRKYGQKPIKGSPYPRNYYRCSTLKGCAARKQVERNPTDPTIFIVSYTGEHAHPRPTHRSSLAGSTRSKFSASAAFNSMIKSTASGESSSIAPKFSPSTSPTSALTFSSPLNQDENTHDINIVDDTEMMNVDDDYQEEDVDYNDENVLIPNEEIFKGLHNFDANSRFFE